MLVSRHSIFSPKSPFGLPDDAFFRQDALSGVPMERFFVRTHFRESRRSVFSPGSTFGNPDRAFFRQDVQFPPGIPLFFARKHNSRQVPALFLKKKRKGGLGKSLARLL
jgi:hypothetical protein